MESFAGWKVAVTGGVGLLGLGTVRAFRMAGATVIVPVRDAIEHEQLRVACDDLVSGELVTVDADLIAQRSATRFAGWIDSTIGDLDLVVAGPLAQHAAIRTLAPRIRQGCGVLAHVSERCPDNWPSGDARVAGLLDPVAPRGIAVLGLVLDSAVNEQDIGPHLVRIVSCTEAARVVRSREPGRDRALAA